MTKDAKAVVKNLMVQIEIAQTHIRNLDSILHYLSSVSPGEKLNIGDVRSRLIARELSLWQDICMWGLTLDNDARDRIKAAAYDRMLKDKAVCSYLSEDGTTPGRWLSSDAAEFREMARKAFAPAEPVTVSI